MGNRSIGPGSYPWAAFAILLALGFTATLLAMPLPFKLSLLLPAIVVLIGAIGVGLLLAQSTGLQALGKWQAANDGQTRLWRLIGQPSLIGIGLGAVLLLSIRFLVAPILPQIQTRLAAEAGSPVWKRFVIAFDSAVIEELLFRLLLLSLLAWLLSRLWHDSNGLPGRGVLRTANLLVAIGFGLAHLPTWSAVTTLTPAIVITVVLLNSIGGITFGYLYFGWGLEAAMLAHFAADIVLHVFGPRLFL